MNSQPNPLKWAVKDTTVNIATAFQQAAADSMLPASNPNHAWASGQRTTNIPRSTSVEYEQGMQNANLRRAGPIPPGRVLSRNNSFRKPPLAASASFQEGMPDRSARGKSPFEQVVDVAKRLVEPATFYLRQRSQEPEDTSINTNGKESSYDYSAEEKAFQAAQQLAKRNGTIHRRNRMSTDNKAYKPSYSDEDGESDYSDDGKTRRRKKKKKQGGPGGGPLTTLPVVSQDRRRKRKSRGGKGEALGEDEESGEDDVMDESQDNFSARQSMGHSARNSAQPPLFPVPPQDFSGEQIPDFEQGLDSIPEIEEMDIDGHRSPLPHTALRSQPRVRPHRPNSVGGFLGSIVNHVIRAFGQLIKIALYSLSEITGALGRLIGTFWLVFVTRPLRWVRNDSLGPLAILGRYIGLAVLVTVVFGLVKQPVMNAVHSLSEPPYRAPYIAPDTPITSLDDYADRLQRIESLLSGLSLDTERSRYKAENAISSQVELAGKLAGLESRLQQESRKAVDTEVQFKQLTSKAFIEIKNEIKHEVNVLQAQLKVQQGKQSSQPSGPITDEAARVQLKSLEERMGGIEGHVKEALELSKKVQATVPQSGSGWWSKGTTGTKGITIKTSEGQDVGGLIDKMVNDAVSMYNKDLLARPDFALHSAGARVIPDLTTDTYELRPSGVRSFLGIFLNNNPIGRPPVTAIHHDTSSGYCWPFVGSVGQLGIKLAAPIYATDITIDHVAPEVAMDIRSAPRQMEVWGLVEGEENVARVKEWHEEKAKRRREAVEKGEPISPEDQDYDSPDSEEYPTTLPKTTPWIRLASFAYSVHAPNNVQTFPVSKEVKELGVDVGIVVLKIKNNWGQDAFTCLYRFRVHGERVGEMPKPMTEEEAGLVVSVTSW